MESASLYEILGVDISANEIEIRRAYFEKAKMYHPDTGSSDPKQFEQVRQAYIALLDPVSRASYDKVMGLRQNFGVSESISDLGDYSPLSKGSLQFEAKNKYSIWLRRIRETCNRFLGMFSGLFKRKSSKLSSSIEVIQESNQPIILDAENPQKTSLAIYSEDSFPLGLDEKIVLSVPTDKNNVDICTGILRKSFEKFPIVERAVLIQAAVSSMPNESVFLVMIEKQLARSWGIDSMLSLELENYPDNMPGMLLCNAANGPFSEAVNLYGIEIYPAISTQSIN